MSTGAAAKRGSEPNDPEPDHMEPESALHPGEAQLRALINAIPNIAWSADPAGNVEFINDQGYKYSGLTPEEALGEFGFLKSIHPDDVEAIVQAKLASAETGGDFELEYRIRRASDNTYRWHLVRCVPVRDAEGNVIRWFGTSTDIEDLKQAQARAGDKEAWFHTLFDSIPMSVALIHPQEKFRQFNDAAAVNLGYTREEFAQLTLYDIEAAHSPREIDEFIAKQALLGDLAPPFLTKHRTKSGELRDVIVHGRYIFIDGKRYRNCVWEDVTEEKLTAAALLQSEKLASVGRMAATMAHEINNPLEVVTNCIYLAAGNPDLPSEVKKHLATAERELRRIAHITRRTLGFYKENAKPANVKISTLVDEVVELYAQKFVSRNIGLKVEHRDHRAEVFAIAGEIRQVISNLLTNANDASQPGGRVRVRTRPVTLNGVTYSRITVADTGGGISPLDRSHIFEPFFTTRKDVGTGLGLWVSREIVQKHGGRIRLRSVETRGTVFSIFLPQKSAPPEL